MKIISNFYIFTILLLLLERAGTARKKWRRTEREQQEKEEDDEDEEEEKKEKVGQLSRKLHLPGRSGMDARSPVACLDCQPPAGEKKAPLDSAPAASEPLKALDANEDRMMHRLDEARKEFYKANEWLRTRRPDGLTTDGPILVRERRFVKSRGRRKKAKRRPVSFDYLPNPNDEVAVRRSRHKLRHNTIRNNCDDSSSGVFTTVIIYLAGIIAVCLLFAYIWKCWEEQQKRAAPFYCPPDVNANTETLEVSGVCTCCSESTDCCVEEPALSGCESECLLPQRQQQLQKCKQQFVDFTKKKLIKPLKTARKKILGCKQADGPKYNEAELRELRRKIVCILQYECPGCQSCQCNAASENDKPKRRRFKLFRKKKKKKECGKAPASDNKLKCINRLFDSLNINDDS